MNNQIKITRNISPAFFLPLCLAVSMFMSCSTTVLPEDTWEGIQGNTLRVFVSIDAAEFSYGIAVQNSDEVLLQAARSRAGLLLLSYARTHFMNSDRLDACRRTIQVILESDLKRFMKCSQEQCTAIFDFNIEKLLDAAEQ
ncbi:MAG: hypothetical protein JXA07_03460 [Spirochaetes bacterium]|nr:hypothetical protein [Spirochaetota bacterium]